MIDFRNGSLFKLRPVSNNTYLEQITPFLVPGEEVLYSFQAMRDGVVFTNKRIIAINVQGITGKKEVELCWASTLP